MKFLAFALSLSLACGGSKSDRAIPPALANATSPALDAAPDAEAYAVGKPCFEEGEPSIDCVRRGKCTFREGACVAARPDDCLRSDECFVNGRCAVGGGECVFSPGECSDTRECRRFGRCSRGDGPCVAATAADCAQSERCKKTGACGRAKDDLGRVADGCHPTKTTHCAESEACATRGACALRDKAGKSVVSLSSPGSSCMPLTSEHCEQSSGCKEDGQCKLEAFSEVTDVCR